MTIAPISYPVRLPIQNSLPKNNAFTSNQAEQGSIFLMPNGNKADKQAAFGEYEQKIAAQNNLVRKHEEAHQSFSGSQALGSPVYETKTDKDGRLIIIVGHQGVPIPQAVDKNAPLSLINQTITAAGFANRGALAPQSFDELSSADKQVAAKSAQILSKAETAKTERLLLQQQFGIDPNQKADPDKLQQMKAQKGQTNPNQQKQTFLGQKLNLIG